MDGDNGGGNNNTMKGCIVLPNDSNNQPQQQQQHQQQQSNPMTVSGERARRAFRARVLEAQAAVLMREDDVLHIPQVDRPRSYPSLLVLSFSSQSLSFPLIPPIPLFLTLPSRPFLTAVSLSS